MPHRQTQRQSLLPGDEKAYRKEGKQRHTDALKKCLGYTLTCFTIAAVSVSMQALALICLVDCHGEDLAFIYVSVWTLLGVGTSMAMLGAALSQAIWLTQLDQPAYNVAMGTPVLVVSAIGHVCYTSAQRMWQKRKDRKAGIEQDM